MSRQDGRSSLSPGERTRAKSRSSSRSQRATPNVAGVEEDRPRSKVSSRGSQRTIRDVDQSKRSESATSSQSRKTVTPTSPKSKRQKSSVKIASSPPLNNRRSSSKRKKSSTSITESERKHIMEENTEEHQNLMGTGLAMVPAEIFQLINLRKLILSNNNLSGLPPAIGTLIHLEYLDISSNPLLVKNGHDDYSCLPREFRHLKNLTTLIMSDCRLKNIPAALWFSISIQTLDLSRNKVGFIMNEIGNLSALQHVRLSHMNLDTLPPEIGFCNKIQTIDLMGNPIDNLPETLVECRLLHSLKIDYRNFYKLLDPYMLKLIEEGKIRSEHIPQVIFELESLSLLDLSQTKINSFSNQHTLMNLNELYLLQNAYFDIPESICYLKHLKLLDMSYNRISSIPDYFERMTSLEVLILTHNKLTILSKSIGRLPSIEKLILDHNSIHMIDKEIGSNVSLIKLDLSHNSLSFLPNEFSQLEQLETLDLRYNKIRIFPPEMRFMIGLKSMNLFSSNGERIGLHLAGNMIVDPPDYIWKSTIIESLFDFLELKEKTLATSYFHLKIIFIGPKNSGKTKFVRKLIDDQKKIKKVRNTIDSFVSILQEREIVEQQPIDPLRESQRKTFNEIVSSSFDEPLTENQSSPNEDQIENDSSKEKRTFPPVLKTFRSTEKQNLILEKSTFITKNNLYCTLLDLTYERTYEILYPLIYDSKALFILPVNLTELIKDSEIFNDVENIQTNKNLPNRIDMEHLITEEWLQLHIFRFIESIGDYCDKVSLAVIGLSNESQNQQQQLLDEIHSRIDQFLMRPNKRREHVQLYSNIFPTPICFDDEQLSIKILDRFELLSQQWNLIHHKEKRNEIRHRLPFIPQDSLVIDYEMCAKQFEQHHRKSVSRSKDEHESENIDEHQQFIENEFNEMNFDDYLEYLKLIGDILYFGQKPQMMIILKPYFLLNRILSLTLFRSDIRQWLNYQTNLLFRFSGFYLTENLFNIDRRRLLENGEFTWKMLNLLFFQSNNNDTSLTEHNLIHYCRLMERLCLGYMNQSNYQDREVSAIHFVCPWFSEEKATEIDPYNYFKYIEQMRRYDILRIERARNLKQQQLWFSIDVEQESSRNAATAQSTKQIKSRFAIEIPEMPKVEEIQISDSQILNLDQIRTIRIRNRTSEFLPDSFYERLVICVHSLLQDRLDYQNFTLGRTNDKNLIEIKRDQEGRYVELRMNSILNERIKQILQQNLFSFYPKIELQIET